MKLIEPSVKLLIQEPGLEGIYKQIERIGRVCYRSEDKITEDSAEPFVNRMIKSKHLAMVEHGTVYLQGTTEIDDPKFWRVSNSPYSKTICLGNNVYITTNLRVLVESNAMELLDSYLCEPTENHVKRICLKFITSIGVSREFNRHRVASVAEQSTRYCNYSKAKFGNEVTFIKPSWYDENMAENSTLRFTNLLYKVENLYMDLVEGDWKPQQAREMLPLCTATEVVYTAFEDDWKHFFDLRYRGTTGEPHPNAKQVAAMAHDIVLKELGKDL